MSVGFWVFAYFKCVIEVFPNIAEIADLIHVIHVHVNMVQVVSKYNWHSLWMGRVLLLLHLSAGVC